MPLHPQAKPETPSAAAAPGSPVRPRLAPVGDLHAFMLVGPVVAAPVEAPPSPEQQRAPPQSLTIRGAWQSFIAPTASPDTPPPRKRTERPNEQASGRTTVTAASLADSAVTITFRHPPTAQPPPRLAAFALPAHISADLLDRPQDVNFALTSERGEQVYGASLQLCEPVEPSEAEVETTEQAGGDGGSGTRRVRLFALVLLSKWPVYELWRTMCARLHPRPAAGARGAHLPNAPAAHGLDVLSGPPHTTRRMVACATRLP